MSVRRLVISTVQRGGFAALDELHRLDVPHVHEGGPFAHEAIVDTLDAIDPVSREERFRPRREERRDRTRRARL